MSEAVFQWITQYGYVGIFFLLMLGIVGLPIPDETLMIFSGYLVFKGELLLAPTIASAFLGSVCGITVSYSLGRTGCYYLVRKYGHRLNITQEKIDRAHDWLEHAGRWGLFFCYFIPGVRHLAALLAGTSRLRYPVFASYAYTGGFVWSSCFITAGFLLGREWQQMSASIHRWIFIMLGAIGCGIVAYYLRQNKESEG